jgi:hypothetical protein
MQSSLAELVHGWHDFYLLVGTASATLVGLMFVTASIAANLFTEKNREALRAFISPTVVHFCAILFVCILAAIPSQTWRTLGGLLLAGGAAGIVYSARVWVQLVRRSFNVDVVDRMFYALSARLSARPAVRIPVAGAIGVEPGRARRRPDHSSACRNSQRLGYDDLDRHSNARDGPRKRRKVDGK